LGLKFDEDSNRKIQGLQKRVVDALNPLRKNNIHKRYQNPELPSFMIESIKKYGFPFVSGNDNKPILLPHIIPKIS